VLALSVSPNTSCADDPPVPARILNRLVPITTDNSKPDRPIVGIDFTRSRISDDELEQLSSLASLRMLNLSWNQFITDKGVSKLRALHNLTVLNLSYTGVTDTALRGCS